MAVKLGNGNWAVKEDKLLAYNDNSGRFFNKEFDFDRGSSATYVGRDGLIKSAASDVPRIDFSDSTNGALKLEPQRTNKITYSEDFGELSTGGNMTIESGFLAPDGTLNARKITCTDNTGLISVGGTLANDARTIYAKTVNGTGTAQLLSHNTNTNNIFTITEQWQRFELNSTPSVASNFYVIDFRDPSQTLTEVILWGAQAEVGSYATSYIPSLSGSATTRLADVCSQTPPSGVIGQTEGTMYVDFNINSLENQTNNPVVLSFNSSNYIQVYGNGRVHYYDGTGNININLSNYGLTNGKHKFGIAYNINDVAFYIDGTLAGTDTNCSPSAKSSLYLGYTNVNFLPFISYNEVKLYNTRLPNAELQALTTI